MGDSVKRGDTKTLKWDLGRDLSAVTAARVIIAAKVGSASVLDRNGVITDAVNGLVELALTVDDFGVGKLEAGTTYLVEIETQPGPLTHPDDVAKPYETLRVLADLG